MSTEQALPAGRELDALIEERIFGNPVDHEFDEPIVRARRDQYDEWGVLPAYSTDWHAAGLVMEHFVATRRYLWLSYEAVSYMSGNTEMHWRCTFAAPQTFNATGDTAPLAICRAALRYVAVMALPPESGV